MKYYKWVIGKDTYCVRVINNTGNYYKNGEIFALYQQYIFKNSDIEITEKEFNQLIGL